VHNKGLLNPNNNYFFSYLYKYTNGIQKQASGTAALQSVDNSVGPVVVFGTWRVGKVLHRVQNIQQTIHNKSMRSPAHYHIFKIPVWPLSSSVNTIQYRWFKICWWTFFFLKQILFFFFFVQSGIFRYFSNQRNQHTDIHNASEPFSTEQLVYTATCNI